MKNFDSWALIKNQNFFKEQSSINLKFILDEIKKDLSGLMNLQNISIISELNDEVYVLCNRYILKNILSYLILSSVLFSKRDSQIHIQFNQLSDFWQIRITDEGDAIDQNILEKIYDNYAGENELAMRFSGIRVAKESIESCSGKMWIDSGDEKNTIILNIPKVI